MSRLVLVPIVALCAAFSGPVAPSDLPMVDLGVSFGAPAATAANETFVWTLTVTNAGPSTAPSVQVTVPLSMGLTYSSASSTDFSCVSTGGSLVCTAGSLAPSKSFTASVTMNAPATTTTESITSTATVSIPSMDVTDTNAANDTASATTAIDPVDLAITKTDLVDPVTTGAALSYTLSVSNGSPVAAHGLVVTDAIPLGTSFVSASGTGWSCAFQLGTVTCTLPELDASATSTVNLLLTAPVLPTMVTNTASVTATASDPSTMNNSSTATTTVNLPAPGSADVSVMVTNATSTADINTAITYTVTVANAGPSAADGVQLVGSLPSTATFGSVSGTGWTCQQASTTLTCQPSGSLAVGSAPPLTITLTAPPSPGTVSSSFVVTASTTDPFIANNTDSVSTLVVDPSHVNQAPTITINGPLSTLEDTAVSLNGGVVVADPDSGTDDVELDVTATHCVLTLASTTGLTFLEGDGVLDPVLRVRGPVATISNALGMGSLTPDRDYDGAAALAIHVDDLGHTGTGGALTADATLSLVVLPVDDPPTAVADEVTVNANVTSPIDVLANDMIGQPGQTLIIAAVTQGTNGAVAIAGNVVSYTPRIGFVGDDMFTYTVSDGTVSAVGNVTVHVVPFTPPTADRFSGGGCSATGRSDVSLVSLLFVYWIIRRARNQSTCSRSAANTDVG